MLKILTFMMKSTFFHYLSLFIKNSPWYLEDRLLQFLKYFFVYPPVISNIFE